MNMTNESKLYSLNQFRVVKLLKKRLCRRLFFWVMRVVTQTYVTA